MEGNKARLATSRESLASAAIRAAPRSWFRSRLQGKVSPTPLRSFRLPSDTWAGAFSPSLPWREQGEVRPDEKRALLLFSIHSWPNCATLYFNQVKVKLLLGKGVIGLSPNARRIIN